MASQQVRSLTEERDELLREYIHASGANKFEILQKIIEIEEELEYLE